MGGHRRPQATIAAAASAAVPALIVPSLFGMTARKRPGRPEAKPFDGRRVRLPGSIGKRLF
jgi:hypothetical protein